MRQTALIAVVVVGLVILLLPLHRAAIHHASLTTCFRNGKGLRIGARVRVDGVEAGSVNSVTVRPALGDYPVEVKLTLDTSYDLPIPGDSAALLSTEGILGPTFVEIDTRDAQGSRIQNNGVLKSGELSDEEEREAAKAMNHLMDAAASAMNKKNPPSQPQATNPPSK